MYWTVNYVQNSLIHGLIIHVVYTLYMNKEDFYGIGAAIALLVFFGLMAFFILY